MMIKTMAHETPDGQTFTFSRPTHGQMETVARPLEEVVLDGNTLSPLVRETLREAVAEAQQEAFGVWLDSAGYDEVLSLWDAYAEFARFKDFLTLIRTMRETKEEKLTEKASAASAAETEKLLNIVSKMPQGQSIVKELLQAQSGLQNNSSATSNPAQPSMNTMQPATDGSLIKLTPSTTGG